MGKYSSAKATPSNRPHEVSGRYVEKRLTASPETWAGIKEDLRPSQYTLDHSRSAGSSGRVAGTLRLSEDQWEDLKEDYGVHRSRH